MRHFFKKTLPVCLLGLIAGVLNGLLGAGGGVAIVLGLQKLLQNLPHEPRAVYVSALCVMLPVSLLSVLRYSAMGALVTTQFTLLALPAITGGAIGAWLLFFLSPRFLARLFSLLVLISGIIMLL